MKDTSFRTNQAVLFNIYLCIILKNLQFSRAGNSIIAPQSAIINAVIIS